MPTINIIGAAASEVSTQILSYDHTTDPDTRVNIEFKVNVTIVNPYKYRVARCEVDTYLNDALYDTSAATVYTDSLEEGSYRCSEFGNFQIVYDNWKKREQIFDSKEVRIYLQTRSDYKFHVVKSLSVSLSEDSEVKAENISTGQHSETSFFSYVSVDASYGDVCRATFSPADSTVIFLGWAETENGEIISSDNPLNVTINETTLPSASEYAYITRWAVYKKSTGLILRDSVTGVILRKKSGTDANVILRD